MHISARITHENQENHVAGEKTLTLNKDVLDISQRSEQGSNHFHWLAFKLIEFDQLMKTRYPRIHVAKVSLVHQANLSSSHSFEGKEGNDGNG